MEEKQETTPTRRAMGVQVTQETRNQYDALVRAIQEKYPGARSSGAFAIFVKMAYVHILPIINSPDFDPFGVREEISLPQKPKQ